MAIRVLKRLLCAVLTFGIITTIGLLSTLRISSPSFNSFKDVQPHHPVKVNLSIRAVGRLGNQMFEFASLVGLGLSNNFSVVLPYGLRQLRNIFEMKKCQFPMMTMEDEQGYHELRSYVSVGYDPMFNDIKHHIFNSNTIIKGFLQSFRYFEEYDDVIRGCFRFRSVFRPTVERFLERLETKNRTLVGIHARRGDFNWKKHLSRGMSVPGASYFHKAMDLMLTKFPNALFIATSDDTAWVTKHLGNRAVVSLLASPFHDLALLASCQHSIISAGTFSWWAGWFAKGTTIYYNDYPKNGSSLARQLNRSDYYYKHWIPLGD